MPRRPIQTTSRAASRSAEIHAPRGKVSLARALSNLGVCTRSQGAHAVRDGRVRVNGKRVTDAALRVVPESAAITIDGAEAVAAARVYVLLNKPRGLVTTRNDPAGRDTVYSCLTDAGLSFLGAVGRLDRASEGALLFTNDTQWANAISAPASLVRKTYHVQIDTVPDDALLSALRAGVATAAGETLSAVRVEILRAGERRGWLLIELDEGRNRHIRRMLDAQGVAVLRLLRVAIGALALGTLTKGEWRYLTRGEIDALVRPAVSASRSRVRTVARADDSTQAE